MNINWKDPRSILDESPAAPIRTGYSSGYFVWSDAFGGNIVEGCLTEDAALEAACRLPQVRAFIQDNHPHLPSLTPEQQAQVVEANTIDKCVRAAKAAQDTLFGDTTQAAWEGAFLATNAVRRLGTAGNSYTPSYMLSMLHPIPEIPPTQQDVTQACQWLQSGFREGTLSQLTIALTLVASLERLLAEANHEKGMFEDAWRAAGDTARTQIGLAADLRKENQRLREQNEHLIREEAPHCA